LQCAHTQGLRRQAQRHAAGAPQQVGEIGVEGVEVDDREGRVECRGGGVERALEWGLEQVHPDGGRYPLADELECRAEHGT
jgi:hypothetical protein